MFSIQLSTFDDVRKAWEWVGHVAQAAGIRDPAAAVIAAGELANKSGEGQIGPMLAGRYLAEPHILTRVINGKPPMMPAFDKQLSPADIKAVTAYVYWLSKQK
jgi:mono/diheme cytochrome c family protein